jgi:hypothetical protein
MLLDSTVERSFDQLAQPAATIVCAPVAMVSFLDEERQFFKSLIGLAEPWASQRETPL